MNPKIQDRMAMKNYSRPLVEAVILAEKHTPSQGAGL